MRLKVDVLLLRHAFWDSRSSWKGKEENYSRGLKGVSHEILLPGLAGGGGVGMAV